MAVPLVGVTTLSSAIDVFAAVNKTLVTEGLFFGLFLNRMPSSHPIFPYTPGLSGIRSRKIVVTYNTTIA